MAKLSQLTLMSIVAGALAVSACQTEDPREGINLTNAALPRGLGERCEPDEGLTCATGLTCYESRVGAAKTCTPDAIAAACTPNLCGDNGLCNARGDADIYAFCRCDSGFQWDGNTCIAAPGPAFQPRLNTTGLTCPAKELVPGVPDETTADCPMGDGVFCTTDDPAGAGDCFAYNAGLNWSIGGAMDSRMVSGSTVATNAFCTREYVDGGEGDSDGMKLTLTGTVASQLAAGAMMVVIDVSNFDAVGGGSFTVWPQMGAPDPAGDAGFVSFSITGGAADGYSESAIAGEFNINFVAGPDSDEDDLIDDDEGDVGVDFILALPNGDFVAGAMTIPCGANEIVAGSGM